MHIGNKVGRSVKIDHTTLSVTRGQFARIYVQIDLQKPLLPFIELLGYLQNLNKKGCVSFVLNMVDMDIERTTVQELFEHQNKTQRNRELFEQTQTS